MIINFIYSFILQLEQKLNWNPCSSPRSKLVKALKKNAKHYLTSKKNFKRKLGGNKYQFPLQCSIFNLLVFDSNKKFYNSRHRLQDDAIRSMGKHSNPVTITFNIEFQIHITFKYNYGLFR